MFRLGQYKKDHLLKKTAGPLKDSAVFLWENDNLDNVKMRDIITLQCKDWS